jgi:hypothetical protein
VWKATSGRELTKFILHQFTVFVGDCQGLVSSKLEPITKEREQKLRDQNFESKGEKMRKRFLPILITIFVALWTVQVNAQLPVNRLSAQYLRFDATETECTAGEAACPNPTATAPWGGKLVYSHAVTLPGTGPLTVYVSLAAQSDTHGGAAGYLHCDIDGTIPCNNGTGGAGGAPNTWVNAIHHFDYQDSGLEQTYCSDVQTFASGCGLSGGDGGGGSGDEHDNALYAHWCVANISHGPHTVNIRWATGPAVSGTFGVAYFEAAHIFIESNNPPAASRCTQAPDL